MKARRRRFRRILKWAGVVTIIGAVPFWGVGVFVGVVYEWSPGGSYGWTLWLTDGFLFIEPVPGRDALGWDYLWLEELKEYDRTYGLGLPYVGRGYGGMLSLGVPLWLVLIVVALPAYFLWRSERRPPPGHCKSCGYDLTGNVSGMCSECGEAIPSRSG